jgi:chorismate mutase-like protein
LSPAGLAEGCPTAHNNFPELQGMTSPNDTPDTPESRLAVCRQHIDVLDRRLVALLNERTAIVEKIGQVKKEAQMAVYEPKREDAVYANIAANNAGPLTNDALQRIFERIMDEMRKVQKERMILK